MKKLGKIILIGCLLFAFTACNKKDTSTTKQEKVVATYFEYLKNNEVDKTWELTVPTYKDEFGYKDIIRSATYLIDSAKYRNDESYKEAADEYSNNLFDKIIRDYKIVDAKIVDNEAIITVDGRMIDILEVSLFDENEWLKLKLKYISEHEDELQQIYKEQGFDAMENRIVDGASSMKFEMYNNLLNSAKAYDFRLTFTVVRDEAAFLIKSAKYEPKLETIPKERT